MENGMLQQPAPQAGQPPQGGQSQGANEGKSFDGQTPNVSPEEQAQYDQFVNNAFKMIYRDQNSVKAIMQTVAGNGDPVGGLANATVSVVNMLDDSATKQGQKIDGAIMFHGGTEILATLAQDAKKLGVHDFTEQEIEGATYRAMDLARQVFTAKGRVDNEALKQDFASILQADQDGKLGEMIPQLKQYAEQHPMQNAPQGQEPNAPEPKE